MKIDLKELNYNKEILIDKDFVIENNNEISNIRDIKNIHFNGKIYYNVLDELIISGNIKGKLILVDAVDLSDYNYKIDTNIEEILTNNENILDINEILWENIVLEVPIRISDKEIEETSGNGWKILSEEEPIVNEQFSKLKDLFEGGEL